ncbi:PREDICTED: ETS homologous factor-like [Diuraphis noxia]|uniref:ETS homologous factor-like n=1 Tax=Diuraphis noxia TaxID=143948 RepID=UPI0007635D6C|nr:PREDICTED: ETS homologous factor-like [Diuraphis noxia]
MWALNDVNIANTYESNEFCMPEDYTLSSQNKSINNEKFARRIYNCADADNKQIIFIIIIYIYYNNVRFFALFADGDDEFFKTSSIAPVSLLEKKRAGRPRGTKAKRSKAEPKLSRIWEFIRDLLLNSQYCPTYICWENYEEGRFRFVQSDKVAKLWGKFKRNERMNYEKFSRAMRYYYKTGVLLPVQGKRLVYKFGPKATGWHTDNPNFKKYTF